MSSFDVESLFQSIDIILTQRLNALSYDTTVIASIIDDSDKDNGHYIVSDGTIKFDAYTSDTTYKSGDQVRVTVVNGDWSQKKFIEGKYSNKENEGKPITYIPPLGTTLQTDFGRLPKMYWELQTNGETYAPNPFKRVIPKDSDLFNLQTRGLYDVLTISADIETNLGQLSAGNYGLRLDLLITPEVGAQYRIQKFITFDSSEMIGNPYSFVIPTHQEKRIAIAELGHVTEIVLTPYQGITIADNGKDIPAPFLNIYGEKIGQLPIIFSNVQIGFGSDLSSVEDNTLKLFTPDVPFYNYNSGFGSKLNKKRLGFTWFNKNEHHEYIGFSDGENKDTSYDEIEYLKVSDFDSRLLAQLDKTGIPSDELSLTLAADIADAVPLMKSAYTALTTDLSQVLLRFHGQMAGATSVLNKLEPLISQYKDEKDKTQNAKLVQHQIAAEAAAASLEEVFSKVLEYGYNVQQGNTTSWPTKLLDDDGEVNIPDYLAVFKAAIGAGIADVEAFLTFAKNATAIGEPLAGYRRIYNDYQPKVVKQLNAIRTYLEQISISKFYDINSDPDIIDNQTYIETLSYYKDRNEYTPYKKDDFSAYANQYCVYWYRYNEGYKLEYIPEEAKPADMTEEEREWNNKEYKYAHFLGDNWERLTVRQDFDANGNIIITDPPVALTNFGLPIPVKDDNDKPTSCEDFLTRWLDPFTETEKYRVVLFYNHEMFKSDIVVFDNADEVPPQYKVDAGDVLKIEHDTDSRDHYQVYSSANDLLNISDGSKSRQLKCFYDGVLSGDETLADAEIYWYIPVNSTMLTYDKEFLIQKGFSTDDECFVYDESGNRLKDDENGQYLTQRFTTQYSKDGYVYFNKKIKYNKEIKDMVDDDGNVMFDSCGQALKETVITIEPVDKFFFYKIKPYYESSAQNNTILVHAYVPNKKEPTAGEITFTFGTFGNNGTKYTLAITPATTQIAVLPYATDEEPGDLPLNITLYNANNEKLDMTTDANGEYHNLAVDWWAASAAAPNFANLAMIDDHYSVFVQGIQSQNYDINRYIGIAKANVSYKEQGERIITLTALHSIPYSSNCDYYISGPTSIIYNSQGTVSRLSEEPYCLYEHTMKGDIKVENQVWSIAYYKQNGEIVEDPKVIRYLPKLMPNHTLQPSPLYCDYGDEHYVPVAICQVDKNIVWTQPIIIIQNAYESSMLNNWNGGLMIDEDNATIMGAMIGAGKKDNENRFSGVLMGDLVAGADFDSKNVNIGIHGFHEGKQSFNFSVDGTAFLGKAGRGRIIFNGNDGVIKSASYDNSADAGMLIDIDNARLIAKGSEKGSGQAQIEINGDASKYGAYFSIRSENDNKLVHIGSGSYYLKSDNYRSNSSQNTEDHGNDGLGMRIDLSKGQIDAYNFRLNSKHVFINSTENASNYLVVKDDDGNSLLYVGENSYYFKSSGGNMNIDLNSGLITANKFRLNARSTIPAGIYLSSYGDEYFWVGSSNSNYMSLRHSSGVDIKTKNLLLDAWKTAKQQPTEESTASVAFAMTRTASQYNIGGVWYVNDTITTSPNMSLHFNFVSGGVYYTTLSLDIIGGLSYDNTLVYQNGEWLIPDAQTLIIANNTTLDATGYSLLTGIATQMTSGSDDDSDGEETGGSEGETGSGNGGNSEGSEGESGSNGSGDFDDPEEEITTEGAITDEESPYSAGEGIYINAVGNPYYFLVGSKGNDNDNYIALGNITDGLDIKTKQFELNAWDTTTNCGIYINSNPTQENDYFKIGSMQENNKNYIQLTKDSKLKIETNCFTLKAGDTQTITINTEANNEEFPFIIQGSDNYAKIGWDGILLAKGAKLDELTVYSKLIVEKDAVASNDEENGVEQASTFNMMNNRAINSNFMVCLPPDEGGSSSGTIIADSTPVDTSQSLVSITGITDLHGETKITGNTEITGTTALTGDVTVGANLGINGGVVIVGDLELNGSLKLRGDITSIQAETPWELKGDLVTFKTLTKFEANSTFEGQITANGGIAVTGDSGFVGNITFNNGEDGTKKITINPITEFNGKPTFNSLADFEQGFQVTGGAGSNFQTSVYFVDSAKNQTTSTVFFQNTGGVEFSNKTLTTFNANSTFNGQITANGGLVVTGASGFNNGVTFTSPSETSYSLVKFDRVGVTFTKDTSAIFNSTPTFQQGIIVHNAAGFDGEVTFTGNIKVNTVNNNALGKLAFADEVKKNVNVTITASLPSGYYKRDPDNDVQYSHDTITPGSTTKSVSLSGRQTVTQEDLDRGYIDVTLSGSVSVDTYSISTTTGTIKAYKEASGTLVVNGDIQNLTFKAPGEDTEDNNSVTITGDIVAYP